MNFLWNAWIELQEAPFLFINGLERFLLNKKWPQESIPPYELDGIAFQWGPGTNPNASTYGFVVQSKVIHRLTSTHIDNDHSKS